MANQIYSFSIPMLLNYFYLSRFLDLMFYSCIAGGLEAKSYSFKPQNQLCLLVRRILLVLKYQDALTHRNAINTSHWGSLRRVGFMRLALPSLSGRAIYGTVRVQRPYERMHVLWPCLHAAAPLLPRSCVADALCRVQRAAAPFRQHRSSTAKLRARAKTKSFFKSHRLGGLLRLISCT
jgi:hypothetical protein